MAPLKQPFCYKNQTSVVVSAFNHDIHIQHTRQAQPHQMVGHHHRHHHTCFYYSIPCGSYGVQSGCDGNPKIEYEVNWVQLVQTFVICYIHRGEHA